jgi:transcriptional regulator with XRE-family HTH domain
MDAHQKLLIKLIKEARDASEAGAEFYSARQMSARSGVNESTLSRFLNGKQDLKAGDYFALLKSFPDDFQERFWIRFHSAKKDWRSQIMAASYDDVQEILEALTEKWATIGTPRRTADPSKVKVTA